MLQGLCHSHNPGSLVILAGEAADGEHGSLLARLQPSLLEVKDHANKENQAGNHPGFLWGWKQGFTPQVRTVEHRLSCNLFHVVCVSTSQQVPSFVCFNVVKKIFNASV